MRLLSVFQLHDLSEVFTIISEDLSPMVFFQVSLLIVTLTHICIHENMNHTRPHFSTCAQRRPNVCLMQGYITLRMAAKEKGKKEKEIEKEKKERKEREKDKDKEKGVKTDDAEKKVLISLTFSLTLFLIPLSLSLSLSLS